MTHSIIYVGTTHILRVDELKDSDGNYVNDATVTLQTLTDADGATVSGVTLPLTLNYVAASNGRYEGELPHGIAWVANQWFDGLVRAVDTAARQREWTERIRATVGRA